MHLRGRCRPAIAWWRAYGERRAGLQPPKTPDRRNTLSIVLWNILKAAGTGQGIPVIQPLQQIAVAAAF